MAEVPMREHSARIVAVVALSVAVLAVPARAQNFQTGSASTIPAGHLRLTASPAWMFGRDGAPDRTGGAFRLGYGMSDSFDVEAKTAFFDGVTLVGGEGQLRVFSRGDTSFSLSAGGHRALVSHALDSTALDLAAQLSARLGQRLEIYGGAVFSWELLHDPAGPDTDFTRIHLVPGARFGVAEKLDLLVEAGVGLNDNSPHYVTAGLAWNVPVSAAARRRAR
jgi:hypothetical protein